MTIVPHIIKSFLGPYRPLFQPTPKLLAIVNDPCQRRVFSQKQLARLTAELLCRLWMNDQHDDLKQALGQLLSDEQCLDFLAATHKLLDGPRPPGKQVKHLSERPLFAVTTAFSQDVLVQTRQWLAKLIQADGFIPVAGDGTAYAIPFAIRPRLPDVPFVVDCQQYSPPAWNNAVANMAALPWVSECQIVLQVPVADLPTTGNSLQLPVLLAIWRKMDTDIPSFHPFKLIVTGAIDNGVLASVGQVDEKYQMVQRDFRDAVFCAPEDGLPPEAASDWAPLVPGVTSTEQLKTYFRELIEHKHLAHFEAAYIHDRIPQVRDEIREGMVLCWPKMLDLLETYRHYVNKVVDTELYLELNMLYGVVLCHCGDTQRAAEVNEQTTALAAQMNHQRKFLRLNIERMVITLDMADYAETARIANSLIGPLEQIANIEPLEQLTDDDLWMRYYGTRGQLECHATVAAEPGFTAEKGKSDLEKALAFARKKAKPNDIAKDLNYLCLWHALFQPLSPSCRQHFEDTALYHEHRLDEAEKRQNNLNYLTFYQCLAHYRGWLSQRRYDGRLADFPRLPIDADKWQRALHGKYFGTLAAAAGQIDRAKGSFARAAALLALDSPPLFQLFRITILAQAFCSLRECGDHASANDFHQQALAALTPPAQVLQHKSVAAWQEYLADPDKPFPGIHFYF